MIIRLDPKDSYVLTRVAQYLEQEDVAPERLKAMLEDASSEARHIGMVMLKLEAPTNDDTTETANYFRNWAGKNRSYAAARYAAS